MRYPIANLNLRKGQNFTEEIKNEKLVFCLVCRKKMNINFHYLDQEMRIISKFKIVVEFKKFKKITLFPNCQK